MYMSCNNTYFVALGDLINYAVNNKYMLTVTNPVHCIFIYR